MQAMAVAGMATDAQRWSRTSVDVTSFASHQFNGIPPRRHSSAVNGLEQCFSAFYWNDALWSV